MRIVLPWPDKRLNPNARVHWGTLSKVKAAARDAVCGIGQDAMTAHGLAASDFGEEGRIDLLVSFFPPDKRYRDDDNMVGSFKTMRDGLADALGVNDRRFRAHYFFHEPDRPGRIEVEVNPIGRGQDVERFFPFVPCDDVNGLPTLRRSA